jgi:RNA polymerase sigma factor (sigma-70 family)
MGPTILQSEQIPDLELVKQILAGEKRLFEQVIRRYNQRLFRVGMSILQSDAYAEEAMQASYVNAYEHLDKFENRSTFGTWLTRIMINECLALKKKQQRMVSASEQPENRINMATPDSVLANKELNTALENAIAKLPEKYRLVFFLREIEDMSVRETSQALGIEEPNVKVRLNRAKTMLRETLSGYMKESVYHFHLSRCDLMVIRVFDRLGI